MTYRIDDNVKYWLKRALRDNDNSQAKLGRKMGIDPSYISKYLSGAVTAVQLDTWDKIRRFIPELDDRPEVSEGDRGAVSQYIDRLLGAISASDELTDAERGKFLRIVKSVSVIPPEKTDTPPAPPPPSSPGAGTKGVSK